MYHAVSRVNGRLVREPMGHNRKEAERRMRAIQVQIDQNVYDPPENVDFSEWCDRWLAGLRREETTRRTYRSSLTYAKQAASTWLELPSVTQVLDGQRNPLARPLGPGEEDPVRRLAQRMAIWPSSTCSVGSGKRNGVSSVSRSVPTPRPPAVTSA